MRRAVVLAGMCWLGMPPTTGVAQKIMYDAVTHDSVALFAFETVALETGDTALVLPYRTFLPLGDTVAARKEALGWWPVVSAHVKTRGYPYALIMAIWAATPTDSFLEQPPARRFGVPFARDSAGCWHLVNDTTPVSTCSQLSR